MERRCSSNELHNLIEAIKSSEVVENRVEMLTQLRDLDLSENSDLNYLIECLTTFWEDFTCLDVSQCMLNKTILHVAAKYVDSDLSGCLLQFLQLGVKASVWCGKHLKMTRMSNEESQEEEHCNLFFQLLMDFLSFSAASFLALTRYPVSNNEESMSIVEKFTLEQLNLTKDAISDTASEVLVELLEKSSLELLNSLLNSDLVRQELKFEMLNWLFAEECRSNSIQGDPSNRTASADEIFSVSCEAMPGGKVLLPGRVALFLSFLMYSPDLEDVKLAITRKLGWFLDTLTDEDLYSSILVSQIPVIYSSGKTLELVCEPLFSALLHGLKTFMIVVSSCQAWDRGIYVFSARQFFPSSLSLLGDCNGTLALFGVPC
ncbi:hypothetical protein LWI29_032140 [Acer saccharum]|uniref:Uncharacterized protein n=1 Tax=Acer saccharum TaxID=4024 RepID=A0AA39TJB1_ACESA|nr:hypothetical protein LWI29_032140 [Acer saccharum]